MTGQTDLILIRHAPVQTDGRPAGRRDLPAQLPSPETLAALRKAIGAIDRLVASPALRCRQTAAALFPGWEPEFDPRLWEQDFGDWEGADPAGLPDPGPLDREALAHLRPPRGESFADLHDRSAPALAALRTGARIAVVAHAGTVRVALSLALGLPSSGLAFEIAPLSRTRLRAFADGQWAIVTVNETVHI